MEGNGRYQRRRGSEQHECLLLAWNGYLSFPWGSGSCSRCWEESALQNRTLTIRPPSEWTPPVRADCQGRYWRRLEEAEPGPGPPSREFCAGEASSGLLRTKIYLFHERICLWVPGTSAAHPSQQEAATINRRGWWLGSTLPFVLNPSKWNEGRKQKGRPHGFFAESLSGQKVWPVVGEREGLEWDW